MADAFRFGFATSLKVRVPIGETGLTPLMTDHVLLLIVPSPKVRVCKQCSSLAKSCEWWEWSFTSSFEDILTFRLVVCKRQIKSTPSDSGLAVRENVPSISMALRLPQMFESQECTAENYAVLLERYLEPSFFEIQEDNMNVCYWKRAAWSCPLYFALP